jgi:FkbM family methyltransferase
MATASATTRTLVIAGQVLRFAVETRREEDRLAGVAAEEGRMLARLLGVLGHGGCLYDVGANIGTIALPVAAARRGPCFAFEAEGANAARLTRNSAINGLGNVTVVARAVWNEPRTVALRTGGPVGTGTHRVVADHGERSVRVEATTIDAFVREGHPPPDAIKVDVEGGELEVLRGAAATLEAAAVRDLFVEVHPSAHPAGGAAERELAGFLAELGYVPVWEAARGAEVHRHFRRSRSAPHRGTRP